MIDPSAYTLQAGQVLVSGLEAVLKAAAETPGPVTAAVAAGSRPGAWIVEAYRDREVLRRVGVELALTLAERDAGVAAVEAWLEGSASVLIAGGEGSGQALAALDAWPREPGERGAVLVAACAEAEVDLWRAAARWSGRVLLEPADLQELKDWTALGLAGDERTPGPTILLAPSRLRRSGGSIRCGFPQTRLAEAQRAARGDPPTTGLDEVASLPQLGETTPLGLASIGPASTVLRQAMVELGLAGRLPLFRAASIDRVDEALWRRMRYRCAKIAVFDCGRGLVSALRLISGESPAGAPMGESASGKPGRVVRGALEVDPDRPAAVAARLVELVRDQEASAGEALRKLVRSRAEAVAVDVHGGAAQAIDAGAPEAIPLRSSISWLLRESGFEVVSRGGLASLASLGRGDTPQAWAADALRVADGSLAASLLRTSERPVALAVVVDLGYTPPGAPGFDLRRLVRRFETQLGPQRGRVLTAAIRPEDDRRSLRLLERVREESQTAVLFADRPDRRGLNTRLRYLGVPKAMARARVEALRADVLHRGASLSVEPSLLASPGRVDVLTQRLPLSPSLAQASFGFVREPRRGDASPDDRPIPDAPDPPPPLHAQRARWWSCLAGAEHDGVELLAVVLAEAGRRHGYRVRWLREPVADLAGSRWHVSFSREPDPRERRAGGSGHWDPATPPSSAAWAWAGSPAWASVAAPLASDSARALSCVDLGQGQGVGAAAPRDAPRSEARSWSRWAAIRFGDARLGVLIWLGYAVQRGFVPLVASAVQSAVQALGGEAGLQALALGRAAAEEPEWASAQESAEAREADPWYDPDPEAMGAQWASGPDGLSAESLDHWRRGVALLRAVQGKARRRAEVARYREAVEAAQRYAGEHPGVDEAHACVDAVVAGWPLLASPYSVRRLAAGLERSRSRSWAPQARRRGELRV
ncbi:MAG: hypothetical protein AAGA57_03660, partial [Planctomycetota bacterium]